MFNTILLIGLVLVSVRSEAEPPPLSNDTLISPANESWNGIRVLHIGDSHLANAGLKSTLRKKFASVGAKYRASAWVGSSSKSWLVSGKLRRTLKEKSPHVVLISLGTNAIKHKHPEKWAPWIKKVVNKVGPRKCYWIAPPPFFEDKNGFYEMLEDSVSPCTFIDSRNYGFNVQGKKHFHFNRQESRIWASRIWQDLVGSAQAVTQETSGNGV